MAATKMITVKEFVDKMYVAKSKFCGISSVTKPSQVNKKSRETGEEWCVAFPGVDPENVRKVAHGCALSGPKYKSIIERRLEKAEEAGEPHGQYVPGDTWHEAVPGVKCLRRHKKTKELYSYFAFVSKVRKGDKWIPLKPRTRIVDISTGQDLDKAKVQGFLKKESAPRNQGLKKGDEVVVRTYKLDSIKTLVVDGTVYTIITK